MVMNLFSARIAHLASTDYSSGLHVRVFAGPSAPLAVYLDKYEIKLEKCTPVPYQKNCIFTGVEDSVFQKAIKVNFQMVVNIWLICFCHDGYAIMQTVSEIFHNCCSMFFFSK